jgi:hypothetical protein
MDEEKLAGKIVVGEFIRRKLPTLTENVYAVLKEAKKRAETS